MSVFALLAYDPLTTITESGSAFDYINSLPGRKVRVCPNEDTPEYGLLRIDSPEELAGLASQFGITVNTDFLSEEIDDTSITRIISAAATQAVLIPESVIQNQSFREQVFGEVTE